MFVVDASYDVSGTKVGPIPFECRCVVDSSAAAYYDDDCGSRGQLVAGVHVPFEALGSGGSDVLLNGDCR